MLRSPLPELQSVSLVPVHKYFLGEALPAHLSPFVDDTRRVGDYVPPEEQNLLEEEKEKDEDVEAGDDDVVVVEVEDDVVEVDEITLKAAKKDRISVYTGLVWAGLASAGP